MNQAKRPYIKDDHGKKTYFDGPITITDLKARGGKVEDQATKSEIAIVVLLSIIVTLAVMIGIYAVSALIVAIWGWVQ